MKIKSSFKDYYDFVAHQYGGGDPALLYIRDRIRPRNTQYEIEESVQVRISSPLRFFTGYRSAEAAGWRLEVLACFGRAYLVASRAGLYGEGVAQPRRILNEALHPEIIKVLSRRNRRERMIGKDVCDVMSSYVGVASEGIVEASKALNAPVFMITNVGLVVDQKGRHQVLNVEGKVPVLAKLGMPAIMSPEQLYQDAEFFMGNVMRASADLAPPVKIDDRDRIVQHGFDLKASFRHRKE